ncbi:NAD-dependent succinate-semialdehyde dehydrogenase [Pelagibacterium limicola]|uniref:NAD-dependent succinate-semialdehyde dehydrogenase n=1 Tax=Pelagibacterium limicola TaxID=2791022 RepID=UPI0018AF6B61|nr:NAD-dependent succinate-semialdehyde dehydrogenase [Pelagibacterium limicola]
MTKPVLSDPRLFEERAFFAGQWQNAASGDHIEVTDPGDGKVFAGVPSLDRAEIQTAIALAAKAQPVWARRTAKERAGILRRWHDLIIEHLDDLALILTHEQGKPLAEARSEIASNAAYLDWFGEEAKRIDGDIIPSSAPNQRILVLKQPVGVVGAITPWNFPNGMITRKAGPALAAGCTMILKPASQTPLSALALAVLAERAGVPPGVFSVITGSARMIGETFCSDPRIAKITFTGSTEVGRWLMRNAADGIKRLSLELGGNAPFIVFADADIDAAVDGAMAAKFRNAGQTCVCANRIYVQSTVAQAFTNKLTERVSRLRLGMGTGKDVDLGPLIDRDAIAKIEDHIADAVGKGAQLHVGGHRSKLGGTFFEPTVLSGVTQDMRVAHEETFAPLAPVITFDTEAQAIEMANDSELGLAGYFYSRDHSRIWRVAEALELGMVGVNCGVIGNEMAPFGGIKQSGLGREGSRYGIDEFLNLKYVCLGGLEPVEHT